ncbi:hypothetical protein PIB30_081168, partial [Stylosanthes scabra]|nr:hypothetical protein [Stylosanthes scabra]
MFLSHIGSLKALRRKQDDCSLVYGFSPQHIHQVLYLNAGHKLQVMHPTTPHQAQR